METFVVLGFAVIVAVLGFVAFRHPTIYSRLHPYCNIAIFVIICAIGVWNLALKFAISKAGEVSRDAASSAVAAAVEPWLVPASLQVVVPLTLAVVVAFLGILSSSSLRPPQEPRNHPEARG